MPEAIAEAQDFAAPGVFSDCILLLSGALSNPLSPVPLLDIPQYLFAAGLITDAKLIRLLSLLLAA